MGLSYPEAHSPSPLVASKVVPIDIDCEPRR